MSRDVMRTCGCSASDSSIIARLPPLIAPENVRNSRQARARRVLSLNETPVNHDLFHNETISGDDVGRARIEEPLDFVLQAQLPLLEAGKLQLVETLRAEHRQLDEQIASKKLKA